MDGPTYLRFIKKILLSDGCWIWQAAKTARGYGSFYVDGKSIGAHRASYEHFVGPIPEGLFIRHKCHNPSCVRPNHLRAGDHDSNVAESLSFKNKDKMPGIISRLQQARSEELICISRLSAKIALELIDPFD